MFDKILIANRGAITTRIIRTLKIMGIKSVAIYAEADADSLHVQQADEAYSLGAGIASETYLNQNKIFDIIRCCGAQAVHPGYGFLSENPQFVQHCEDQGIVFLGPTVAQMAAFGLKHSARELAQQNQVPLLPGSGLLDDIESALENALRIAYPVMLKSTAGGGGIGMQLCRSEQELIQAYASVKRLSESNFANSGIFLEKYIENARHIEVQVFGDGRGEVLTLGERDCSAQRRNQKVIEETPAPNIPPTVREQLQLVAQRLCAAVYYRSAGTVEFILDARDARFYFLEVNTRLQVEHGVTEQIYGIDLIEWMVKLGAHELESLPTLRARLAPQGHSIQARVYAENPSKQFLPSAGLLSLVSFPPADGQQLRIEHWIESGVEVSPYFDPMLAKIIVHADSREKAIADLEHALQSVSLYGIETNKDYLATILATEHFKQGNIFTDYLNHLTYQAPTLEIISSGTQTSIQDYPGRIGYWDVGVPPSGPFDSLSFRLGNRLLGNNNNCAGLEITLNGPTLKFNCASRIVLTGAAMHAHLDDSSVEFWKIISVNAGQILKIGKLADSGARAYLLVDGGIQCPDYLGAKATFSLGRFGGHAGRLLRPGDVLHLQATVANSDTNSCLASTLIPAISHQWDLHVIYGPHGAPDFFTVGDIDTFFNAQWEVHYNSSRTGIRLIGPKPQWARSDGGEAGMHPSNIHDNAYAIGAVDFTGDMPVILGPDGPSLGGFVCPATVINADLWKLGQLKAGDTVRFIPISIAAAVCCEKNQALSLKSLQVRQYTPVPIKPENAVLATLSAAQNGTQVVYRAAGDHYLLVEYGPQILDINLRFRVHALMQWLQQNSLEGIKELTPGVRSLQIHYDSQVLSLERLLDLLNNGEQTLSYVEDQVVSARIVHLPLSWDDDACQQAVDKYMQSVRKDAPWCPSNIEFIRRINGLDTIEQVKEIVFNATYVVMGLGDVYLGAPVATPLDPCHRLVTTKYNPARTWTAENSVGIGGSYLCVYGMEGPGGYQFVGRTLQMWNPYRQTAVFSQPWLLRFFDQIRFYPVSAQELLQIRQDFPTGKYQIKIEPIEFSLQQYNAYLADNADKIQAFTTHRQQAFNEELARWIQSGQINFETEQHVADDPADEELLADHEIAVESHITGNIWQILVAVGDTVETDQCLLVLESMKMEIQLLAPQSGKISAILKPEGSQVTAGQRLMIMDME